MKRIERLSVYRRFLQEIAGSEPESVYSHELAEKTGVTPAQVRRDLMEIGFAGHTKKGYRIAELIAAIGNYLDSPQGDPVALVGLGNLGRALLPFFAGHHPKLKITAAFDTDPLKAGRVICGCRCYPLDQLEEVIAEQNIRVAILTVPATAARKAAQRLAAAGVRGILNFAPALIRLPKTVTVETMDITIALEKIAFFARRSGDES